MNLYALIIIGVNINEVATGPAGRARVRVGIGSGQGLEANFRASCIGSVSRYRLVHECACADIASRPSLQGGWQGSSTGGELQRCDLVFGGDQSLGAGEASCGIPGGIHSPSQSISIQKKSILCQCRPRSSCKVSEGWKSGLHVSLYNLQKAFDSVEYSVLLERLYEVGVSGKC